MKRLIAISSLIILLISCSVQYSFTGGNIDYNKYKTVSVDLFPNRAPLVNPVLSQEFTEGLKDFMLSQTQLDLVKQNGDLHFEGEIVDYNLRPMAIQANATSAETRLTIKVQVRFYNKIDPDQDFESSFSAYADFETTQSFMSVEADLVEEIKEQIYENIFNKSIANW